MQAMSIPLVAIVIQRVVGLHEKNHDPTEIMFVFHLQNIGEFRPRLNLGRGS